MFVILAACAPAGPAFTPEDEAAVRENLDSYATITLAQDWDALVGLYTTDAVRHAPNEPTVGYAAMRDWLQAYPLITAFEAPTTSVDASGDLAVATGTFALTLVLPGVTEPFSDKGKWHRDQAAKVGAGMPVIFAIIHLMTMGLPHPRPPGLVLFSLLGRPVTGKRAVTGRSGEPGLGRLSRHRCALTPRAGTPPPQSDPRLPHSRGARDRGNLVLAFRRDAVPPLENMMPEHRSTSALRKLLLGGVMLALAGCAERMTVMNQTELTDFATRYAAAWSSQDPASLAVFYTENGSLTVNEGNPSVGREAIATTARSFMTAFPDMVVVLDEVTREGDQVVFRWIWTGTNTGPGGTGSAVRMTGHEVWTIGADGLITESKGHYDEAEYQRQLQSGRSISDTSS